MANNSTAMRIRQGTVIILQSSELTVSMAQAHGAAGRTDFLLHRPRNDHLSQQIFLAFEAHIFAVQLPGHQCKRVVKHINRAHLPEETESLGKQLCTDCDIPCTRSSSYEWIRHGWFQDESLRRTPKWRPQFNRVSYLIIIAAAQRWQNTLITWLSLVLQEYIIVKIP